MTIYNHRKINPIFLLLFLLFPVLSVSGQNTVSLCGHVRDTTDCAVAYCAVSILQSKDSLVVGGTTSDTTGFYRLEFKRAGRYLLRYDHIAYVSHMERVDIPASGLLDVALTPVTGEIDEVVVLAQYTKYEAGKTTVSMVGNPIAENRTVTETLDLIPGITVREGAISIHGQPISAVYINDRKATEAELAALLADHVNEIEIQNKAGSAYDATTSGGILRIRLRKLSSGSFYGNVNAETALSPYLQRYAFSVPFNLQYGKLNLYNYASASYNDSTSDQVNYAEYRKEGYLLDAQMRGKSHHYSVGDVLSLVYEINPRHSLGVYGGFKWTQSDPTFSQITSLNPMPEVENPQVPDARHSVYNHGGDIYNRTYQAVANYKYEIDSVGSNLLIQADFAHQRVGKQYDYTTLEYRTPTDESPFATERLHESYTPVTSTLQLRADLTKNLAPQRTLGAGLTYDYGQIDNNSVMTKLVGQQWIVDDDQSVWFLNRTQSAGAYATFADSYGKFSYQAGLRFQWDRVAYKGTPQDAMTHRDYYRWFPEVSLVYAFNEERGTALNLDFSSYSDGIPSGTQILSKRTRISEYSYSIGNPLLNPYRGFYFDLTYTLRGRWTFCYYFSKNNGLQYDFTFFDPDDPQVVYTKPMNGGTSYSHYLAVGVDTPVTKWMRLSADLSGKYGRSFYALGDEHYASESKSAEFNCKLVFEPIKSLRITASYQARTKQQFSPETTLNADHGLYAIVQKSFFKNRLMATFTYAGIIYTEAVFTTRMSDGSYFATSRDVSSPRRWWSLGLSWRFNHKATKSISTVSTLQNLDSVLK